MRIQPEGSMTEQRLLLCPGGESMQVGEQKVLFWGGKLSVCDNS